jgi:hypothetical protein
MGIEGAVASFAPSIVTLNLFQGPFLLIDLGLGGSMDAETSSA